MADDVEIKFGAQIDELKDKLGQIGGLFQGLTTKFAAMAAIVGGGVAFKSFIDEANTLNSEATKLSRTLGITGEDAGSLNTALGDIGADSDTYVGAFLKFNRALRSNSEEMQSLGVDVGGLKSGMKSSNDVFVEALSIVNRYKPGIDQTQVAMKLFGRSVEDVQKIQRLANDVTADTARRMGQSREELNATLTPLEKYKANLAAAAEKNRELNLTVTEEGVAASRKYKEAMNDVGDVLQGLQKTIGEAVIPHFTAMAERLASIGPALVQGMQYLSQTLVNLWDRIGESVDKAWTVISGAMGKIAAAFGVEGKDGVDTFKTSLQGLQDALYDLFDGIDAIISGVGELLGVVAEAGAEAIKGVTLLVGLFNDTTEAADRATGSVGAFAEIGRALGDVFRVIAVLAANVAFVLAAVGREIAAIGAQIVALARLDLNGFRAISDAVKADGVRARAELDALERRILGVATLKPGDAAPKASPSLEIKTGTPKGAPPGGTQTADIGKANKNAGEEQRLAALLALQKAKQEAELALQMEYLKENQSFADEAFKNNLLSLRQYWDARLAIETIGIDSTLAVKRKEMQDAADAEKKANAAGASAKPDDKNKFAAQALRFQTEQVRLQGQINVLEAQRIDAVRENAAQYLAAEQQRTDALAAIRAGAAQQSVANELAIEKGGLEQMKALRQISADDAFAIERALEEKSYAALLASLAAKAELIRGNQQLQAELDAARENAEQQHQARLIEIDRAAELQKKALGIQARDSVQQSFATMIDGLLAGVTKLSDIFRNFGISIANTFTNLIAQKFTDKLFEVTGVKTALDKMISFVTDGIASIVKSFAAGEMSKTAAAKAGEATRIGTAEAGTVVHETLEGIKTGATVISQGTQTAATVAGAGIRVATEEAASEQSVLVTVGAAIAKIAASAWEAAASVYANVAKIPYVGWILAPAMAVAAGAAVMGFASRIVSSAGGEERVDQDRLNFVHKDETILPVRFADGLRNLIANGNASQPLPTQMPEAVRRSGGSNFADGLRNMMQSSVALPTALPSAVGRASDVTAAAAPSSRQLSEAREKSGRATNVNYTVHAIDASSVKKLFMDHGRTLADSLARQQRNHYVPNRT